MVGGMAALLGIALALNSYFALFMLAKPELLAAGAFARLASGSAAFFLDSIEPKAFPIDLNIPPDELSFFIGIAAHFILLDLFYFVFMLLILKLSAPDERAASQLNN